MLILDITDAACSDIVNTDLSGYLYLIMFGMFLIGIPGATQLTVGMSYIDDSVPVNSSPLYRGKGPSSSFIVLRPICI